MTSKIAKLQALLYMAGDGGIKKEQLRDLLQLADHAGVDVAAASLT